MYKFSMDYFLPSDVWKNILSSYIGHGFTRYLELGVAEGQSMVWMLENVLTHSNSRAIGVDLFPESQKQVAHENICAAGGGNKVQIVQNPFSEALREMERESFDIIYHDGGHCAWQTLESLLLAWPLLKDGGVLIIDDYEWQLLPTPEYSKKLAIDSFLSCFRNFIEILSKDRQVILRKVSHMGQWISKASFPLNEWSYIVAEKKLVHFPSKRAFILSQEQVSELLAIFSRTAFLRAKDARELQNAAADDPKLQGFLRKLMERDTAVEDFEPVRKYASTVVPKARLSSFAGDPKDGDFFRWRFGDVADSDFASARSPKFSCWFEPSLEPRKYDFREEVFRACALLDRKRAGKTVALCFTGGKDSNLIAEAFSTLGIPFRLYFLRNWHLNEKDLLRRAAPSAKRFGKEINVVDLSREYFFEEFALSSFKEFGCEAPTYLALLYLFQVIPECEYIVVGDGDLERDGHLYREIARQNAVLKPNSIPMAASSILFSAWKKKRHRDGEFNFFRSTAELVAATFTHPGFQLLYPFSSTREVIRHAFPEVPPAPKSTNWDSFHGFQDNAAVRRKLMNLSTDLPGFADWRPAIGTNLCLDDLLIR